MKKLPHGELFSLHIRNGECGKPIWGCTSESIRAAREVFDPFKARKAASLKVQAARKRIM